MLDGQDRLTIASNKEYSVPQLRMMLREVEENIERQITFQQWDFLGVNVFN